MACTDQCKRNFGWEVTRVFSYEDMQRCILPEDLPAMQEKVAHAIEAHQPYIAQYRIRDPDGSLHWIEAQGKFFYNNDIPQSLMASKPSRRIWVVKIKDPRWSRLVGFVKSPGTPCRCGRRYCVPG